MKTFQNHELKKYQNIKFEIFTNKIEEFIKYL